MKLELCSPTERDSYGAPSRFGPGLLRPSLQSLSWLRGYGMLWDAMGLGKGNGSHGPSKLVIFLETSIDGGCSSRAHHVRNLPLARLGGSNEGS